MKADAMQHGDEEEEEEFVLLDLDDLPEEFDIPPNAPYVLSGLDTLNPILIIDGKLKLIGEYEETIGTCFVFSENEAGPEVHEITGPSEENLFAGKRIVDSDQSPRKQLEPVAHLHKILKFRIFVDDDDVQGATPEPRIEIEEGKTSNPTQ
ncbi:hypothetical protein Patl1_04607 [Pistacia atlantica]|uniref:Uncharacterized protein n=1 Tax=Pistacia atlantica TaxID=434234 RepID=A0ACC1BS42_9ROSI|nr:hypothetical protein Patl1_04607 [Pistacia atlantica]